MALPSSQRPRSVAPRGRNDHFDEDLSALIGDIYDAAMDATRWPDVLKTCAAFVGGSGASLYSKDSISLTAEVNYSVGIEESYRQSYVDTYVKIDPTTPGFFFFDIGEIIGISDILPVAEFVETRFFKEWVQPQGLVDTAVAVLEKTTTGYAVFGVFRDQHSGLVDEEVRRRMELLVPHIRRAVLIGGAMARKDAESAALSDTLDVLAAGTFLVDGRGRLAQANVSGHAMLAEARVVRAVGGRLAAVDPAADIALRDALAGAEGGDTGIGTQGIAVPMNAPDGERYVAHLLPLTSGARRTTGARYAATAAVFVCKAQRDAPSAPEAIAKLYSLTPSELRVLLAICEASGVADAAERLGISEATAKTHLRRLFEKTNTSRQVDLVKLVMGFSGPG